MKTTHRILSLILLAMISVLIPAAASATDPYLHPRLILNEYNAVGPEKYIEGYVYSDYHNGKLVDDEYIRTCKDRDTLAPMPLDPDYPAVDEIRDGRIEGNLGDWIELVVIEDHLDIRGWELRWAETDVHDTNGTDVWYGNSTVEQGIITFSETAMIWSDLRKGTIITIAEKHDIEVDIDWDSSTPPNRNFTYDVSDEDAEIIIELRTDTTYDPGNGDWWIHVDTKDEAEKPNPVVTTVSNVIGHVPGEGNFSVGNDNWQCTVVDDDDFTDFGPVGEAVSYWGGSGINSRELGKLEADPVDAEQQYILNSFNDGSSSTFSLPNLWDTSTDPQIQHFGEIRSWAFNVKSIESDGAQATISWNDILGFERNGVMPWYLTDVLWGNLAYVVEWSVDMVNWTEVEVGTATSWTDTNLSGYTHKVYRVKLREQSM